MLRIYIARHGQDEDNAAGILNGRRNKPLTYKGRRQAEGLADKIESRGIRFDAAYSSPLQRAYATGKAVTDRMELGPPAILHDLIERNFGVMTGVPVADIAKLCAPDIITTEKIVYFLSPEGAETFPVLLERGTRVLADITRAHPSGSILLATHGDIGKMIYASYYGIPWKDILTMFYFDNSGLLLLAEDSPPETFYA